MYYTNIYYIQYNHVYIYIIYIFIYVHYTRVNVIFGIISAVSMYRSFVGTFIIELAKTIQQKKEMRKCPINIATPCQCYAQITNA